MAVMGINRGDVKGALRGVFANVKTTPIRLGGGYIFINAGAKTMAVRADKVNEKLIRKERINIVAQISGDAKAGSYYGIYAVRLEAIEDVLKFFKGKKYFVIMGDSDSDYVYLSVYWGHLTYLHDRAEVFCKFLARYLTETAIFLGTKTLSVPDLTMSSSQFISELDKKIDILSKHTYAYQKLKTVSSDSERERIWKKVRRLEVSYMVSLLKGAPTMYIPDDACMQGIMKMSNDHKALQTANDAIGALRKVEDITDIDTRFVKYKTSAADIFSKFDDYIKKVMSDYDKQLTEDKDAEVLQMILSARDIDPDLAQLRKLLLENRRNKPIVT